MCLWFRNRCVPAFYYYIKLHIWSFATGFKMNKASTCNSRATAFGFVNVVETKDHLCYSASASVIYFFVSMNTISRKQQKHKEPFLGWHTSLQTLWNGNNLYATFLFNQPSVVPCKCITGRITMSPRTFQVAHPTVLMV